MLPGTGRWRQPVRLTDLVMQKRQRTLPLRRQTGPMHQQSGRPGNDCDVIA